MSKVTLTSVLKPVAIAGKTMAGDALRRSHWTQACGGSVWTTRITAMIELQNDKCALCGDADMTAARISQPKAITAHRLLHQSYFGTETARMAALASNGKPLDPYRFGFVAGNVVAAHNECSMAVYGEKPTGDLLQIDPSQIITEWTPELNRPTKVKAPAARENMRRRLQAIGWMAEG